MKNCFLLFSLLISLGVLQGCTTLDKTVKESPENKRAVQSEEELLEELHELKSLLGNGDAKGEFPESKKLSQPVEFGMSLKRVQTIFPAPDKFEYRPFVNGKVTMLSRDASGGRFNFFFYEDEVYKIILIKRWGSFSLKFAKGDIDKFINVYLENYGRPDERKSDNTHQKLVWIMKELEVTIEVFNLMSHSGLQRVLTLAYADRRVAPFAKRSESFEFQRTKKAGILDQ